jgi:diguanylate cyclase (GGDEF)-like protein
MRYCARLRPYLLNNVRAEDFVCRFGGEEFVIILPPAGRDGAHARAERLRSKMRERNIMYQGKSLGVVTFSVAVAGCREHGMSPKDLMAAADAVLYAAKHGGRDQLVALASAKAADEMTIPGLEESPTIWS